MSAKGKLIVIVAHNLYSGGAATASRRLMEAFSSENFEIETNLVKDTHRINKSQFRLPLNRVYSSLISRLDRYVCFLIGVNNEHWSSTGLLGQISAREIERN